MHFVMSWAKSTAGHFGYGTVLLSLFLHGITANALANSKEFTGTHANGTKLRNLTGHRSVGPPGPRAGIQWRLIVARYMDPGSSRYVGPPR